MDIIGCIGYSSTEYYHIIVNGSYLAKGNIKTIPTTDRWGEAKVYYTLSGAKSAIRSLGKTNPNLPTKIAPFNHAFLASDF